MNKSKRFDWYSIVRIGVAILLSFALAAVIIFFVADDPAKAMQNFFLGGFSSLRNFSKVIQDLVPLVFCGMAINVMHKSGLFSMAADSSLYLSGVVSTLIAIGMPLPAGVHQFTIIIAGTIVGGLVSIIPVILKRTTGANELVVSLMMNYISFNLGYWIIRKTYIDNNNGSYSIPFLKTATLGTMVPKTGIHYGLIIMIFAVIIMWIVMNHSRYGRELEITGSNSEFAKYAGISVGSVIILSQLIGGMLAGMGGAIHVIGAYTKFEWNIAPNYVWDGILINLLSGKKVRNIPLAAFFLAYIRVGANVMSRNAKVATELVAIIQGIVILLIASERFLYGMKKRQEEREVLANAAVSSKEVA